MSAELCGRSVRQKPDLVCGLGPFEWLRVVIVQFDEGTDVGLELLTLFSPPSSSSVAVGRRKTPPTPQMMPLGPGTFGDKNKLWTVSPRPNCSPDGPAMSFCQAIGRIVREMMFESSFNVNGMTGCTFTKRFVTVVRAVAAIPVKLERHAHQGCNWVGKLLRQVLAAVLRRHRRPAKAGTRTIVVATDTIVESRSCGLSRRAPRDVTFYD